ncbi:aminotransferase class I/II-fold pyridoxal phosphate-dependent enzyme [Paenibacillus sp. GCM10012306]|uniref:aminotransferase class I/II-fold pyridoxal phosphate-dependent enzyme n=1 Tax=Paenibacillus sp. GCM10012306 TaxID=3317342 RepID=UPI00360B53A9
MNKDKRSSAPIYEMLEQYKAQGNTSYHVPGHKNGKAYEDAPRGAGFLGEIMKYDVTEITGTDDLHHPEGVIKEAQELAADCFGAEESFFLVGGSTAGNLALILTVCPEPGIILIVQRNVHKSVIHGLMLAGVRAVFLEPEIDPLSGLAVAPAAETVQAALAAYPEAAAVLVTMPNYYGMGSDLTPLAQACHNSGVPLLVDEAHGAHYGQHPALPAGALMCGADGVVQSTHKMLSALTMGAMLHVQGPRIDRALLRQRLAMVQSSSPSYPLMGSLDLARRLLHSRGPEAFTAGLAAVDVLQRGLAELPRFRLLQPAAPLQHTGGGGVATAGSDTPPLRGAAYTTQDPFKAVLYDGAGVLGGFELQRRLEAKGCVPEMSDDRHVVLLFSLGSSAEDAQRLLHALREIDEEERASRGARRVATDDPYESMNGQAVVTSAETSYLVQEHHGISKKDEQMESVANADVSTWNNFNRELFSAPVPFSLKPVSSGDMKPMRLADSVGEIAAEMVIPYPPGIPLLYPGEKITMSVCQRLMGLARGGAKFQACADSALQHIMVYNTKKGGED